MRSRRLPTSFFWMFTCGAFRLHSAGVSLCIPPVAPADVPAIPAQELGHLPAVLKNKKKIELFGHIKKIHYLCGVIRKITNNIPV